MKMLSMYITVQYEFMLDLFFLAITFAWGIIDFFTGLGCLVVLNLFEQFHKRLTVELPGTVQSSIAHVILDTRIYASTKQEPNSADLAKLCQLMQSRPDRYPEMPSPGRFMILIQCLVDRGVSSRTLTSYPHQRKSVRTSLAFHRNASDT